MYLTFRVTHERRTRRIVENVSVGIVRFLDCLFNYYLTFLCNVGTLGTIVVTLVTYKFVHVINVYLSYDFYVYLPNCNKYNIGLHTICKC